MAVFFLALPASAAEYVPGRVIVKLKGKASSLGQQKFMSKIQGKMESKGTWSRFNMHSLQGKQGQSTEELIAELSSDPDVEFAEPDYILKKQGGEVEGQAYTMSQVRSFVTGFGMTSANINGVEGWQTAPSPQTTVVAVIDTGVDLYHELFEGGSTPQEGALWINSSEIPNNGIDDDGNGYVDDVYGWNFVDGNNFPQDCDGHGTHVAGIVRGTTQDVWSSPIDAAVIKIMPLKFLDCYGSGTTSGAISAIYYAVRNGAKVLNNSWGGGAYSRALVDAIAFSYQAQTVFVAAAGNNGMNNDTAKMYPASYNVPNIISVAATSDSDLLAGFSNYGASTVHLAAPGVRIRSSVIDSMGVRHDLIGELSGTSMAAPFVAGVAARIMNERPGMNGYQVKKIITYRDPNNNNLSSVDPVGVLNGKVSSGGRLNSMKAIANGLAATLDPYMPPYTNTVDANDRELASALASGGGGCGLVKALQNHSSSTGGGGTPWGSLFMISVLLMIPVLLAQKLRRRENKRQHTRYAVHAAVKMKIGDQEVAADLSSISAGGAGIEAQALLNKGSLVTLKIEAPDGTEMEVQGRVVWKSSTQSYGIQFTDEKESLLDRILSFASYKL